MSAVSHSPRTNRQAIYSVRPPGRAADHAAQAEASVCSARSERATSFDAPRRAGTPMGTLPTGSGKYPVPGFSNMVLRGSLKVPRSQAYAQAMPQVQVSAQYPQQSAPTQVRLSSGSVGSAPSASPQQTSISHQPPPVSHAPPLQSAPEDGKTGPFRDGSLTVPVPMPCSGDGAGSLRAPASVRAQSPVVRQHTSPYPGHGTAVVRVSSKDDAGGAQSPQFSARGITITSQLAKHRAQSPPPAWPIADGAGREVQEALWSKTERRIEAAIDSKVAAILDSALQEFRTFASACVDRFSEQLSTEHKERELAFLEVQDQLKRQRVATAEELALFRGDLERLSQQPATAVEVAMDEVASARLQIECLRRDVNALQLRTGQFAIQAPLMSGVPSFQSSERQAQSTDPDGVSLHSGDFRSAPSVGVQIEHIAALVSRLGQDLGNEMDTSKSSDVTLANGELTDLSAAAQADFIRSSGELDDTMRSKVAKLGNQLKALAQLGHVSNGQESEREITSASPLGSAQTDSNFGQRIMPATGVGVNDYVNKFLKSARV